MTTHLFNEGYKPLYIGGELRDATSGGRHPVICPATEETVATVAWAGADDAESALSAAHEAFSHWSALPLVARRDWMFRLAEAVDAERDRLQNCVMHEHGKTWEQADEDVSMLVEALRYYPEEMARFRGEVLPDRDGTHRHELVHQPVGVAVAYLAWNFPLLNLAYKIGPALASGCTLIVKPSSETPLSAYVVGEICRRIGFPAGVVNILAGPSKTVASALSRSDVPRLLTLIGSTETGLRVIDEGATSVKRYSMELGGNAPAIVLPDADLDLAARTISTLKYANAGQICVAPNRVLVHASVVDHFLEPILKAAREVKIGFGRNTGASMGPLINADARQRIQSMVNDASERGASLLTGGKQPASPPKGYFFEPTVLTGVAPGMRVWDEEVFGPIVSITTFTDTEEVLRLANDTPAGLASFLFGQNQGLLNQLAHNLTFGEVMINGFKYSIDLPHIGINDSGLGCDCSHLALHDYLTAKRITRTE